jgi:chromosomal replication initiation ATPase DnaA
MYVMKMKLKISLKQIGRYFGKDHTTVIHAIRKIDNELSIAAYRAEIKQLINAVIELL